MVVYKQWKKKKTSFRHLPNLYWNYEGWFLFGFIPLYIKRSGVK